MNTIEAILSRRSIRRFTQEPLTEEQIETILKCACAAPSAMNGQPWYFLVITDRQKLNEISEHHPYSSMLKEAPMAILVMGKISQNLSDRYIAQDLSASTQNILLAAHDMGLGAVWMGIFPVDERAQELTKVINIPQPYFPFSLIAVGHAAEAKGLRYNYTPNRVFWEKI